MDMQKNLQGFSEHRKKLSMSNTQNETVYTSRHQIVLKVLIHFFITARCLLKATKPIQF